MTIHTKICGIKTPEALEAACSSGARYIGFVFFPPSPRHVEPDIAKELVHAIPTGVRSVGLFVDPSDAELERVLSRVQLDMIQLHGDEKPERLEEIKKRYNMPIIKAFPVREDDDLRDVETYRGVADMYLFDAKPVDADLPGGTGQSFDWDLLRDCTFTKPWMLSGGLSSENVGDALAILSPAAVDVSSGVEAVRGEKDIGKIRAFLAAVKAL